MAKQKRFTDPKKNAGKQKKRGPESANEFLAAGVDFEEAGEKWRAGDAEKSLRFFVRAIETYDAGLQFSPSFDLAYNKARLQYDVAQQPRLLAYLPTPLVDLLKLALDSHRYAMSIEQENADLLFNTGQVLTSLAETVSEGRNALESSKDRALTLFQEALGLFQRCLELQEFQFAEAEQQSARFKDSDTVAENEMAMMSGSVSDASEDESWASVMEPVTRNTLVDTLIAQLETLTTMCNLAGSQRNSELAWIEDYSRELIQGKIAFYVEGTQRHQEVALTKANLICAYSDYQFRSGFLDLSTYERDVATAFVEIPNLSQNPQMLCDMADAELALNASVTISLQATSQAPCYDRTQLNTYRWTHLTKALDHLTAASKLRHTQNLPKIHLHRGDCELLRYRLGEGSVPYDVARKSASTLIGNAEVYYRGAARLARNEGAVDEEREALVKEAVAASILGNVVKLSELVGKDKKLVSEVVEDMRDEGLLSPDSVSVLSKIP